MRGYSFAMLALFYWMIGVMGWRKWSFPFRVIGMNAIFAHMASRSSECAEDPVAGVAQPGDDVELRVEALVLRGGEDRHVRMLALEPRDSLGGAYQVQELDAPVAELLELRDRVADASARRAAPRTRETW